MSNKVLISIVWVIGVAVVVSAAYLVGDGLRWITQQARARMLS